jgi:hypothetical protein
MTAMHTMVACSWCFAPVDLNALPDANFAHPALPNSDAGLKDKTRAHLLCPSCNAWFEPGEPEDA